MYAWYIPLASPCNKEFTKIIAATSDCDNITHEEVKVLPWINDEKQVGAGVMLLRQIHKQQDVRTLRTKASNLNRVSRF